MRLPILDYTGGAITAAGIYRGVPAGIYHGQFTAEPSLSSSGARKLLSECPAIWHHGSYLNPLREREEPTPALEFGSAAHYAFLEPAEFATRVAVIDAPDWRSKAAQAARDAAREAGQIPILVTQAADIEAMRAALRAHPIAGEAFADGEAELSVVWRDAETGVWCKARPDWLRAGGSIVVDYKTAASAHPSDWARKAFDLGYHQQAAWYLAGLSAVLGGADRAFWFVSQEKAAPFLSTVSRFRDDALAAGDRLNRDALRLFARCLDRNEWPGYRRAETPDQDTAFEIALPAWAQRTIDNIIAAE